MIAFVAGDWVDLASATIPIDDRGFLLGDGVYDTCRVYEGKYFRFEQHARRLEASGRVLRIPVPEVGELRVVAEELLERNQAGGLQPGRFDHAVLRLTVSRGSGGAGLGTRGAGPTRLVATLRPMAPDWPERARNGWAVMTAATRHPPPEVLPPALKGQGRVSSLLARIEAEEAGCDDALLLSIEGRITEGTTWNIFWRSGSLLRTPAPAEGLLAGVTRQLVLELAADAGYPVEEGAWPRAELDSADEAFATMTSLGIVPINTLDGRSFPGSGQAAADLAPLYWDRVREEVHG